MLKNRLSQPMKIKNESHGLLPYMHAKHIEVGCDEAGRGCIAGPVFAAAVILPPHLECPQLNDSKQLTEKQRNALRLIIEENALDYAVASCSVQEIEEINILQASIKAMHKALKKLKHSPEHILVDGNHFKPFLKIPHTCVIKGDATFLSIAAASILAKTHRDEYMEELHREYPDYQWIKNKGYPTKQHREAIRNYGATPHHRKNFKLL